MFRTFIFYAILDSVQSRVCYYSYYVTDRIRHYAGIYCYHGCCYSNPFICCKSPEIPGITSTMTPRLIASTTSNYSYRYSSTEPIAAIVIGCVFGVSVFIGISLCVCYFQRRKTTQRGDRTREIGQPLTSYITTSNTSNIQVYCIQGGNRNEESQIPYIADYYLETPPAYELEPPPPYSSVTNNSVVHSPPIISSTTAISYSAQQTTV